MKNYSKYGRGWYNESRRHALSAKGVKTGRKSASRGFGLGTRFVTGVNYSKKEKLYKKVIPLGYGRFTTRLVTKEEMLKYLKRYNPTEPKSKLMKRLKQFEAKRINYYKISSISDKSKLYDIQQEINRRLKEKGYSVYVSIKDSSINLSDIRISEERVQKQGHNIQQAPFTKSGVRRTRSLSWDDWVEVNDTVNDILDKQNIKANVKSLGGKFDIRDKTEGRRSERDWDSLRGENVGSMMRPVLREDYIKRPQKKEGTQFGILGKEGKVEKHMTINIGKVKSDDPLAYSYGYFQAKSGQPMSKDKNLAPEYIRGYKDAKAGKKINYAYTPGDLPGIVTTGLGTAGAEAVGWVPAIVAVGATKHIVKQVKGMTKKKKKRKNYAKGVTKQMSKQALVDSKKLEGVLLKAPIKEVNEYLKTKNPETFRKLVKKYGDKDEREIIEKYVKKYGTV